MTNILIVGAGVVGQATGKGFAKKGHQITFVDVDKSKISDLQQQGHRATTIVIWRKSQIQRSLLLSASRCLAIQ